MNKLFLSLDDAVFVTVRNFGVDEDLARQELEQKCYINDDKYSIGYEDGLLDAIKSIEKKIKTEKDTERTSKKLYFCDPNKNTECSKTGCFINGGPCYMTSKPEFEDEERDVAKRLWEIAGISAEHGNALMDLIGCEAYKNVMDLIREDRELNEEKEL